MASPLSTTCAEILSQADHACIGVSPFNSYFSVGRIRQLAEWASGRFTRADPAGDVLQGASYLLLDATGQEAGHGTTDAQGTLTFPGLTPGVYRLQETACGSPIHDVAADQDVIVIPGVTTRLAITDPFKAAHVLLKAKDAKTGKPLPGATMNIGSGDTTVLTLTTGPDGTAAGDLPVSSRTTEFWAKQIKAPAGYSLSSHAALHRRCQRPGHRGHHQRQDRRLHGTQPDQEARPHRVHT
ncbi:tRNA-dependent cyclodipeptide synthase [Streptomyces sp. NPDC051896]|uniref:tRNA-dependent cyclodipeptide synthase n=1 Tax=Streptomyces sp. NPDC051896 TaxID=3155416 RepID=UPI003417ABFB